MTETELLAIEGRAISAVTGDGFWMMQVGPAEVLALVSEVRRLRGSLKDLLKACPDFDKPHDGACGMQCLAGCPVREGWELLE